MKTDEELILECRAGNGASWETLIKRHQDRILNLAYQFTGNKEEARDVAQDIFVRLYIKKDHYQPGKPFKTWFNSLARNLCIDHYRRRIRDRAVVNTPVDEFVHLPADIETTDNRLHKRERKECVQNALRTLGEISREAIILKDLQGHSLEEVAEMLGTPIGTVKSRVFRARIELGRAIMRLQQAQTQPEGSNGL